MSCVSMMSFTPNGRPFRAPGRASRARAGRARAPRGARARDRATRTRAPRNRARRSARGRRASAPRQERRPAAIAASASIAVISFGFSRNGNPCDRAYPMLTIASKLGRGRGGDGSTGGVPDHGSNSTWLQVGAGRGRARARPCGSDDLARAIGAAPRAAGGSQDPRHRPDDEQHHQQSRLHDLRHAVLAGQQARAEAADGGELHAKRRRTQLDVQASAGPQVPRRPAGDLQGRGRVDPPLLEAHPGRRDDDAVHEGDRRHRPRHVRDPAQQAVRSRAGDAGRSRESAVHHARGRCAGRPEHGDHDGDRLRPVHLRPRGMGARQQDRLQEESRLQAEVRSAGRLRRRQARQGRSRRVAGDPGLQHRGAGAHQGRSRHHRDPADRSPAADPQGPEHQREGDRPRRHAGGLPAEPPDSAVQQREGAAGAPLCDRRPEGLPRVDDRLRRVREALLGGVHLRHAQSRPRPASATGRRATRRPTSKRRSSSSRKPATRARRS